MYNSNSSFEGNKLQFGSKLIHRTFLFVCSLVCLSAFGENEQGFGGESPGAEADLDFPDVRAMRLGGNENNHDMFCGVS